MVIDLSSNGTLADEAALLTAFAAVLGAGTGVLVSLLRKDARKTRQAVEEVVSTLNHTEEEIEPGVTPSVGQRVVRIERQVDSIQQTMNSLNSVMSDHIQWEQKKYDRLEQTINGMDKRLTYIEDATPSKSRDKSDAPTRRPRKRA